MHLEIPREGKEEGGGGMGGGQSSSFKRRGRIATKPKVGIARSSFPGPEAQYFGGYCRGNISGGPGGALSDPRYHPNIFISLSAF